MINIIVIILKDYFRLTIKSFSNFKDFDQATIIINNSLAVFSRNRIFFIHMSHKCSTKYKKGERGIIVHRTSILTTIQDIFGTRNRDSTYYVPITIEKHILMPAVFFLAMETAYI